MKLIADEKTVPRIHLVGTLLILVLITVGLSAYFSWSSLLDERAALGRIEQAATDHVEAQLEQAMHGAIDYIDFSRSRTESNLRESLIEQVDIAYQTAQSLYASHSSSQSADEVERLIVETLRPIRFYDGRGYYFIDDMRGRFVLLPIAPDYEGKTILDNRDDQGRLIMRGLIDAARKPRGEGFYAYRWYSPDNARAMSDKLAYVRYFAPYDWLIGTGDYVAPWEQRQQQERPCGICAVCVLPTMGACRSSAATDSPCWHTRSRPWKAISTASSRPCAGMRSNGYSRKPARAAASCGSIG